ncbi:hypothetical protein Daesc_005034 [Daldinia eschscholtzii]|uniref:Uncharacterized protein n=1 Tax=Daldinia eschscholtzii TaxID=292717 RepID=A0AAX6MJA4_9PEZI
MRIPNWTKPKRGTEPRNFLKVLVDPQEANIDIVAVHGLNPLDKPSHAEATWTAGDKLWLKDFLPEKLPTARVLLFGYNSNVAFQTATSGVREQAENLLNRLEGARTALFHSNNDRTYKSIAESTFGIAFFGTPHRGGNNAEIGGVVANIARSLLGNPSNTFMSAVKEGTFLDLIEDDFRQLLESFQILTFYETKPMGRLGIVVDQNSAILGLPGTREKQIALDKDHRNICKFSSHDDPEYQQVADNIASMVYSAIRARASSEPIHIEAKGNTSSCSGSENSTWQAGFGNKSQTIGDANKTRQFGHGNESENFGDGNKTIQVSGGVFEIRDYIDLLRYFNH